MAIDRFRFNVKAMKTLTSITVLVVAVLMSKVNANGQKFQFTFRGTCWTTNAEGRFITKPANNKTLLQEYALATGAASTKGLVLAYHYKGADQGDVVEVVNAKDGTTVYALFGLFFSDDFGRLSLTNSDLTQEQSIDYIYTHQMDHSAGSALTSKKIIVDRKGNPRNLLFQGQVYYDITPDRAHSNMQICSGTFITGKPIGTNAWQLPTKLR